MAALRVKSFEKLLKFSSTFLLSPKWLKDVIFIKWNLNCVAPSYVTCAIYVITWPIERCSKRPSIGVQFEWFIFKKICLFLNAQVHDLEYKLNSWGQRRSLRSPSFYIFTYGYVNEQPLPKIIQNYSMHSQMFQQTKESFTIFFL